MSFRALEKAPESKTEKQREFEVREERKKSSRANETKMDAPMLDEYVHAINDNKNKHKNQMVIALKLDCI